ncbi:MAG: fatty acid desaturase [Cyclobacteriaceae bacterium]|nr:MAG: fatty acid desaturase [Cyclobacteriaceae bacterium]
MKVKTVVMLGLYFIPLILIGIGLVTNVYLLFGLYLTSGVGMAGIGMGVMHDAIHGSYSGNKKVNRYLGYTMNLIGANAAVWKVQHNVLHHTYTNIDQADDDINPPFFLRFSPHARRHWVHRFQHLYVWFFYGLSTISWVTAKDFVRMNRYRRMGFFKGENEYRNELIEMIGWKLFYYCYALILPIIMVPLAWWLVVLAFISMHFLTGTLMSLVFQTAHVMPGIEFPLPDDKGRIDNEWAIHQLATTTNYSPNSRYLSWLIGGLNFQIEHHLFPDVCHIHYKKLSPIVAETAREYGIPYNIKKTFLGAIWDHGKMLNQLGKK